MNTLLREDLLENRGNAYKLKEVSEEKINEVIQAKFGQENNTPEETEKHYEEYGFSQLIASVSKWIDHDGRTVRTYDEDRLWLGKYIDFLEVATEWASWFKSDQAIVKQKIAAAKKASKK